MPGLGSLMAQLSCPVLSITFQPQHQLCTPRNGLGHFAQSVGRTQGHSIVLASTPLDESCYILTDS